MENYTIINNRYLGNCKEKMTSLLKALFIEHRIPWRYHEKYSRPIIATLNNFKFKIFLKKFESKKRPNFYIVVIPPLLHLVEPCLKQIPKKINIGIICNGLNKKEQYYINSRFKKYKIFKFIPYPNKFGLHSFVIDMLFLNHKSNFGIIDLDCFVFNPKKIFGDLQLSSKEFSLGPFIQYNKKSKLYFPRTYFLFFNHKLAKKMMKKYKVNTAITSKFPKRFTSKLNQINITLNNLPTEKGFFDSIHLIYSLAYTDGYTHKYLKTTNKDLVHVGGVSYGFTSNNKDAYSSYYFHLKLLENSKDPLIKKMMIPRFGRYRNSKDILQEHPEIKKHKRFKDVIKILNQLSIK